MNGALGRYGRSPGHLVWMAAALAGSLALPASVAQAQQRLVVEGDATTDAGEPAFECISLPGCTNTVDCASAAVDLGAPLVCSDALFGEQRCQLSLDGRTELICCGQGGVDTCPERLGSPGKCVAVGISGPSVCVYPDLFRVCNDLSSDSVSAEVLQACLTSPDPLAEPVADWNKGDCDRDGVPNGLDCYPCDHNRQVCIGGDGGIPDGGAMGDGGAVTDGGNGGPDGGGGDGGTGGTEPISFRGDGGCQCRTVTGGDVGGGILPALFVLGLLVVRRRRHG